jgi:peptide/nickel transport system permease protein
MKLGLRSRRVFRVLGRSRLGFGLVGAFVMLAVFGPMLSTRSPNAIDLLHAFEPPSRAHWLGTADNGIDLLSGIVNGARIAGLVAVLVVGLSVLIGTALGVLAGYRGGKVDDAISWLADLVQAFPSVLLNVAILAVVASPGLVHLVFALVANGWVIYARMARTQALTLRSRDYIVAARALGYSEARILARHLVPNLLAPLVIQATAGLGGAILAESTLSFLGLGLGGHVSWGSLLDQGSSVLLRFPHVALITGGVLALTILGFNLAGDGLRDLLDPKSK